MKIASSSHTDGKAPFTRFRAVQFRRGRGISAAITPTCYQNLPIVES